MKNYLSNFIPTSRHTDAYTVQSLYDIGFHTLMSFFSYTPRTRMVAYNTTINMPLCIEIRIPIYFPNTNYRNNFHTLCFPFHNGNTIGVSKNSSLRSLQILTNLIRKTDSEYYILKYNFSWKLTCCR
jgi:hypothetical protein